MTPELFKKFSAIAYAKAGIFLKDGKETLVSARVRKRQRALGIEHPKDYLKYLEDDESGDELVHFLDAISTNFTSFFREREHFDLLAEVIKAWIAQGRHKLRIWSAAASSGEEPYSLAITILEAIESRPIDLKILATDISTRVLQKARDGIYPVSQLESLSKRQRLMFFLPIEGSDPSEPLLQVTPEVRQLVTFKRLNLSVTPYPMKGPFDLIFCRNVMIYFDKSVRQKLVTEFQRLLKPDGYLITSHTESLMGLDSTFSAVTPSIYRSDTGRKSLRTRRSSKTTKGVYQSLAPRGKVL